MHLRDHPLMTYRGVRTWPPVWTLIRGIENSAPKGEVGVLKEFSVSAIPSVTSNTRTYNRIFLFIEHDGRRYIGCLMLEDYAFCQEIAKLLNDYRGRALEEIGSAELGRTL